MDNVTDFPLFNTLFSTHNINQVEIVTTRQGNPKVVFTSDFDEDAWSTTHGIPVTAALDILNDALKQISSLYAVQDTLGDLMVKHYGNKAAVARYLGLNRTTVRTACDIGDAGLLVVNNVIYRSTQKRVKG